VLTYPKNVNRNIITPGKSSLQSLPAFLKKNHVAQVDNSKDDLVRLAIKKIESKFLVASYIFGDILEFSVAFAEFY
jgi:hypothetical protein